MVRRRAGPDTPVVPLVLVGSDEMLIEVSWADAANTVAHISDVAYPLLVETAVQLEGYFGHGRVSFDLPLVAPGARFQFTVVGRPLSGRVWSNSNVCRAGG